MNSTISIGLPASIALNLDSHEIEAAIGERIGMLKSLEGQDSQLVSEQIVRDSARRIDSLASRKGIEVNADAVSNQLFQQFAVTLAEPVEKFSSYDLFPLNNSVALGATSYGISRNGSFGEASVITDSTKVPVAGVSSDEDIAKVRYLASSYRISYFAERGEEFRNTNLIQRSLKAAQNAVYRHDNELYWGGDVAARVGINGIFNHPYLMKQTAATSFTTAAVQADPDGTRAELNRQFDYASVGRDSDYGYNKVIFSNRLYLLLSRTKITGTGGTPKSILATFIEDNGLSAANVMKAKELQNVNGVVLQDGIIYTRTDNYGMSRVSPMGLNMVPITRDLASGAIIVKSNGGMIIENPESNMLVLCMVSAQY